MTIEANIKTALNSLAAGKAWPVIAPDPVVCPYIIFQVIHEGPLLIHQSAKNKLRIQIDVWDKTYGGAKAVKELVKTAINAATSFSSAVINSGTDLYDAESKKYRELMEFYIWE